jgi:hypothetical protein
VRTTVIAIDLATVGIYEWEWRGFLFARVAGSTLA